MNNKTTPKDFFLHLGATIALYISAIALMNLFFAIANKALPDALGSFFTASSIVWPVSVLIVLTLILYVIEWLIGRDIIKMPEKKEIWIRRWRIYLTLFLTGATIAGDLIFLINTYLNGEVTGRFVWKILAVFAVSAVIFAYYLLSRLAHSGTKKMWQRILAWLGIILVIGAIVSGFVIVGSPAKQRAERFDEQRVSDLTTIQSYLYQYWEKNYSSEAATSKLPSSLDQLVGMMPGVVIPVDPETGAPYEYSVVTGQGNGSYILCATFDLPSSPDLAVPGYVNPNFPSGDDLNKHPGGHTCFSLFFFDGNY